MSRKQIRITTPAPASAQPPSGTAEAWVGTASPQELRPADLWIAYAERFARCRTPQDLVDLQIWAARMQAGAGLAAAALYAQAAGSALAGAATALSPRG